MINSRKSVVFGAGKIGRSFIGQLFSQGGFEVVFIDKDKSLIQKLNQKRSYNVIIKSEKDICIKVENVRCLSIEDKDQVAEEITTAYIMAISVGREGLDNTFPLIANGLVHRFKANPEHPLDIIIAENIRNGSEYVRHKLQEFLPEWFPLNDYVGTVETSIGKMVPIMTRKDLENDPLQVFAEPYNTLIIDRSGFKNAIPNISGLAPKDNIKAWVDRKLFIHNLGHSSAAYLGYLYNHEFRYIYEALQIPEVYKLTTETMVEAATLLCLKYPGEFTMPLLKEHIDDLLTRFQNKALGDTIFRVGCDLYRKLGSEDRLAGCIRLAMDLHRPCSKIVFILACAMNFRATDEEGNLFSRDSEFYSQFNGDFKKILSLVCGFEENTNPEVYSSIGYFTALLNRSDFKSVINSAVFG